MSLKELYRDDLLNRFASHTFTETTVGSMTLVEFKDGSSVVVGAAQTLVVDDAYKTIREDLVGTSGDVMLSLTATQRDALTSTASATLIFVESDSQVDCYNGTEWEVVGASEWKVRTAQTVTTTDATQTVVDSFTIDDEESYLVQISIVATQSGGSNRGAAIKSALVYRTGGGIAIIQGTVVTTFSQGSDGAWLLDITVSGNDVRASVTGVAATTITWKVSMQYIEQ